MTDLLQLLDQAETVVRAAGATLTRMQGGSLRTERKELRDVVTEADLAAEEIVVQGLRRLTPNAAILAEERGSTAGTDGGRWIIDPLDGTVNYANGLPVFCVSIGLVVDGRAVAGVVLDPTRDEVFAATDDGPATLNGRLIRASTKERLTDYVISLALAGRSVASRARAIRKAVRVPRSMGSASLGLAYVGNGRFDAFVQESGLSAWDIAAAGLIAERAGATVTAFDGSRWYDPARKTRTAGIVAAPPAHQPRLRALATGRG